MSKHAFILLVTSLLTVVGSSQSLKAGSPVLYTVTNRANQTAGGVRFDKQIGPTSAKQTMYAATRFVWVLFNQTDDPTQRKNITQIDLFIDDMGRNNTNIATTNNASIHVNANFIGNYAANLRRQFNGIMYQEVAGIWQWDARGQAPSGLVTGIANYVRLQARYGTVEKVKPGEGERWDQGNGVTAKFLSYCNQLKRGFVGELNNKMRNGYSDGFFLDLLGKTVDHLWSDYRDSYGL